VEWTDSERAEREWEMASGEAPPGEGVVKGKKMRETNGRI
jgi:hypothetical protein